MSKIGSFNVVIQVDLDREVTLEEAQEIANEMNYELKDTTGKVTIKDTKMVEISIEEDTTDIIGMDDCPPDDIE